jgi:hypothetical protein
MKNYQGSIVLTIIGIIAILAIGGGIAYIATRPSMDTSAEVTQEESVQLNTPASNSGAQQNNGAQSIMDQSQANAIVSQNWTNCTQGDCANITVSFTEDRGNQYLITAIATEYDDSVSQTKKEFLVISDNNGGWILSTVQPSPNTWRTCHRGNSNGTTGWTTGNCI